MLASYTHNVHVSITALAGFCGTRSAQGGMEVRRAKMRIHNPVTGLDKVYTNEHCSTMQMLLKPFMAQLQKP